jgi:lysophospholipase L1-like esterase
MRLARLDAFLIFLAAGAVGAMGLYLTWDLAATAFHPGSVRDEAAVGPERTALTQPLARQPVSTQPASPQSTAPQSTGSVTPPPAPSEPAQKQIASLPPAANPPREAGPPPVSVDVIDPKFGPPAAASTAQGPRGLTILHIGDSHTSADFLTGELRRRLQARYGRGGTGYMTAGHPHIGVRSSTVKIAASAGWTYKSLQRPDAHPDEFWLSGYDAVATAPGETMSFTAEEPLAFDMIEIEAIGQPGGGAIDIKLDGRTAAHYDLAAPRVRPVVIRLLPQRGPIDWVREVSVTTTGSGIVSLASASIYNNHAGLTYDSVGYVGAQVTLMNKMSEKLLADDLRRLDPQIVVLSFGTNEASNEYLDIAQYAKGYERVVDKIRTTLPSAAIVLIGPPDFNELPTSCGKAAETACRRTGEGPKLASAAATPLTASDCAWRTPAKLAQIREAQRDIAERRSLAYWNWASIMPAECGASQWLTTSPPLMSRDHVHFTAEGYKKSAEQFLNVLIPVIEKVRAGGDVVSND